jgi:hypothetical protein
MRLLGFGHFTLYDNGSEDNTRQVLQPFVDRGWVTLIDWPTLPGEDMWGPQGRHLEDCLRESATFEDDSVWRGAFDVDEFVAVVGLTLSPKPFLGQAPFALHHYLNLLEDAECGGIIMDRVEYAADFVSPPPGGLVITDIVQRRVSTAWPAIVGKPLVFADGFARLEGGLNFTTKQGFRPCLSDRTEWDQVVSHPRVYEPIRLHHYVVRSYEECLLKISADYNSKTKWTWRTEAGQAFCNQSMPWTPEYEELKWVEDAVLVGALFPEVISQLLPHFKD